MKNIYYNLVELIFNNVIKFLGFNPLFFFFLLYDILSQKYMVYFIYYFNIYLKSEMV